MKCQECDKAATIHITECTGSKPYELHLCEEHANHYLKQTHAESEEAPSLAGVLAQQLAVGQTAEDLARLDQKACPVCGITFYEFRSKGRLGCPHDYTCFAAELEPLIANIHGETEHVGKVPHQSARGAEVQTRIIRLRREMKDAVAEENYERASAIRDQIRQVEEENHTEPGDPDKG
jgi:protein arginine kinase activator